MWQILLLWSVFLFLTQIFGWDGGMSVTNRTVRDSEVVSEMECNDAIHYKATATSYYGVIVLTSWRAHHPFDDLHHHWWTQSPGGWWTPRWRWRGRSCCLLCWWQLRSTLCCDGGRWWLHHKFSSAFCPAKLVLRCLQFLVTVRAHNLNNMFYSHSLIKLWFKI